MSLPLCPFRWEASMLRSLPWPERLRLLKAAHERARSFGARRQSLARRYYRGLLVRFHLMDKSRT